MARRHCNALQIPPNLVCLCKCGTLLGWSKALTHYPQADMAQSPPSCQRTVASFPTVPKLLVGLPGTSICEPIADEPRPASQSGRLAVLALLRLTASVCLSVQLPKDIRHVKMYPRSVCPRYSVKNVTSVTKACWRSSGLFIRISLRTCGLLFSVHPLLNVGIGCGHTSSRVRQVPGATLTY